MTEGARAEGASAVTRDQRRALHAYQVVLDVPKAERRDYKIALDKFTAHVLHGGLSAALAALEREKEKDKRRGRLLAHLAEAHILGLEGVSAADLPARVRELDVTGYMMATRDVLRTVAWLRRAVQAVFPDEDEEGGT